MLKLQARVFAIMFSYLDYRHNVVSLLQELSHGARAFVWNLDGLTGYVKKVDVMVELRKVEARGVLTELTKY